MMHVKDLFLDMQVRDKLIAAGLGILCISAGAWWAYNWYAKYQGQKAQVILSECLAEYQTALEAKDSMWMEVKLMNDLGFDQASGSSLPPYFLVMQAQALARQNNIEEAVCLMDQAIMMVHSSLPYQSLYSLTKALMMLDAADGELKQQGVQALTNYAHNDSYPFQDAALYYLGDYYFGANQENEAKATWALLLDKADGLFKDSPYVHLVQNKYAALG